MDRDRKFEEIKEAFKAEEDKLLRSGKTLFWDTEKGVFGTSSMDSCFKFFKEIGLEKYEKFIDLGCGDGRIVLIASLFTKAVGIEFDETLLAKGVELRDGLGLSCELIAEDYYSHDISGYDFVFMNPDQGFVWGMDNKLSLELTGELYVYNDVFVPNVLKEVKKYRYGGPMPIVKYVKE